MICDVHTHVGLDLGFYLRGWWPYASTAGELLGQMDTHGVDRAVCFPFTLSSAYDAEAFAAGRGIHLRPGQVPFARENAALVREIGRLEADRRLLPLAMIDPGREIAGQLGVLEALAPSLAGLKLQATVIESPVAALLGDAREFMALAAEKDLPVLLHCAVHAEDRWSQVRDCLDVAAANPMVRFNIAHSLRFHERYLREAATAPNVWVDCAAHLAICGVILDDSPIAPLKADRLDVDFTRPVDVLLAVHEILGQRYLWGSDHPYMSWCDDTLRIMHSYQEEVACLRALPASVRKSMGETGPQAWLGPRGVRG